MSKQVYFIGCRSIGLIDVEGYKVEINNVESIKVTSEFVEITIGSFEKLFKKGDLYNLEIKYVTKDMNTGGICDITELVSDTEVIDFEYKVCNKSTLYADYRVKFKIK